MVLAKDKFNSLMKNQELADEEIEEKFGINSEMLKNFMYNVQNTYTLI